MDLVNGSVISTLLLFSGPFILSTLLQTLYATVDTIVVGQFLGSAGLSAVSNGSQIMQLIYMVSIGFINAGQVLLAQSKGAENQEKLQKVTGTLFLMTLGLSVLFGVLCLGFSGPMLTLLHTPPEAFDAAKAYIRICGGGMIFTGFYNMFSAIFRGMGDSRHPLLFVFIASVINLFLDLIFVATFRWGVAGAAWATIIGQAISVIFSIRFFHKHASEYGIRFSAQEIRYDSWSAENMFRIGIPMALQSGAIQISFLFASGLVNTLGVDASAAFGVSQKLRNLPGIMTQGMRLAVTSMIGQNLGARKYDRVDRIVRYSMLVCFIINFTFGIVFAAAPLFCFRLFTQDEHVLAFAAMCMFTLVIELPGRVVMPPCGGLIHAIGHVKLSLTIAFLDAFAGRILLCWLLGSVMGMGAYGYFLGYALATYITSVPEIVYYLSGRWRKRQLLV